MTFCLCIYPTPTLYRNAKGQHLAFSVFDIDPKDSMELTEPKDNTGSYRLLAWHDDSVFALS